SLLRAGVVLAATAPLSGLVLSPDAAFASTTLCRASFTPHRGKRFRLATPAAAGVLTLVAIEDLPNASPGHNRRFSLIFRPTSGPLPSQGTWVLKHPALGTFSVFLVPVGRNGDLQAVFNAA
ncbi:MAG: hypothetical protein QOE84_1644, partial [Actinomycetota bacterium]|nr:hypothetical protein [Actinomycetota bacterium]